MKAEVAAASGEALEELGQGFDDASQVAYTAAKDARALKRTFLAGLNPPDSARRTQADASGDDPRRRPGARMQGNSIDR
jgi:hypothetical protein